MIIVAGSLNLHPDGRARYLDDCIEVVRAARSAAGCIDFHMSADPIEPGRINIFEQWESIEAVEAYRGSGTSEDQRAAILSAHVVQHEVGNSTSLT